MRLASADDQRGYREGGLLPMPTAAALNALGRLLAAPHGTQPTQAVVAQIDWSVLKPLLESRRARPLLAHLGVSAEVASASTPRAEAGVSLAERLAAVPQALRHEMLVEFVQREVADVLALGSPGAVPVATGLFDLGMDSLMSVELKRRLERGAGRGLPSTLTFNYPNVEALARFLESQLTVKPAAPVAVPGPAPSTPTAELVPASDAELDALSDDELEARLLARLEQAR